MNDAGITFVVLTHNEAGNIGDCLRSLPEGSPTLVYDANSADATANLAHSLGATVVQAPWAGYVAARSAAAALVKTPWTFMLDADERLTIALCGELARLEPEPGTAGYCVARRNWFCGRWVRRAGWWPDRLVRLFRTGLASPKPSSSVSPAQIHETWQVEGAVGELCAPLEHFSYPSLAIYRSKFARYTALEAAAAAPSLPGFLGACVMVPARFCWLMLAKAGLLEGWRGAYICAASAAYPAAVKAKALSAARKPASRPGEPA